MEKYLFISRHQPNNEQINLAAESGVELIHVGDLDAFADDLSSQIEALDEQYEADGVVCVHPLIALTAANLSFPVGLFNNVNRAPVGEKPQFGTDKFVIVKI